MGKGGANAFDRHVADVRRQLRCVAAPRDSSGVDTLWELGVEGTQGRSVCIGSALYTALLRGDGSNRSLLRADELEGDHGQ